MFGINISTNFFQCVLLIFYQIHCQEHKIPCRYRLDSKRYEEVDTIPDDIPSNVKNIWISRGNIEALHAKPLQNWTNLLQIIIQNTKLSYIETGAFNHLHRVKKLCLHHNELTHIREDTFQELQNLIELSLYANPIISIEHGSLPFLSSWVFELWLDKVIVKNLRWKCLVKQPFKINSFAVRKLKIWFSQYGNNQATFPCSKNVCWLHTASSSVQFCPKIYSCGRNEIEGELSSCEWINVCKEDLCGMTKERCTTKCINHGFPGGKLIFHQYFCPFKYFCKCYCKEFDGHMCLKKCSQINRSPVNGALDEDGCPACNCSCPVYTDFACQGICAAKGKLPFKGTVDKNNCSTCECQCKIPDCFSQCPGLFKVVFNAIGCQECECATITYNSTCIDCEKECDKEEAEIANNTVISLTTAVSDKITMTSTATIANIPNGPENDTVCYKSCSECPEAPGDQRKTLIMAIVIPCGILFIISTALTTTFRSRIYRPCSKEEEELLLDFGFQGDVKLVLLINNLDAALGEEVTKCWIEGSKFTLEHLLGHGNFGTVWSGNLTQSSGEEIEIAIKKIKGKRDPASVEEFLREAIIMRQLNHPHVLSLIGVSVHEDKPCVLLPFMSNRDLKSYVAKHENDLDLDNLLLFALGVAKGMEYLTEQKFVHRDLAARNCMLDSKLAVKVADFGLTRDVYEKDYYVLENKSKGLPIRWMSIEAIQESRFTTHSDVIFTFGALSYQGLDNIDIGKYLQQNRRLPKPTMAPPAVYDIMLSCWHLVPQERPTYTKILSQIDKLADSQANYMEAIDFTAGTTHGVKFHPVPPDRDLGIDDYLCPDIQGSPDTEKYVQTFRGDVNGCKRVNPLKYAFKGKSKISSWDNRQCDIKVSEVNVREEDTQLRTEKFKMEMEISEFTKESKQKWDTGEEEDTQVSRSIKTAEKGLENVERKEDYENTMKEKEKRQERFRKQEATVKEKHTQIHCNAAKEKKESTPTSMVKEEDTQVSECTEKEEGAPVSKFVIKDEGTQNRTHPYLI